MTSAKILLLGCVLACPAAMVSAQTATPQAPTPDAAPPAATATPSAPDTAAAPPSVLAEPGDALLVPAATPTDAAPVTTPAPPLDADAASASPDVAQPATPTVEPAPTLALSATSDAPRADGADAQDDREEHRGLFDDRLAFSVGFNSSLRSDVGYDLFTQDDRFDAVAVNLGAEVLRLPRDFALAVDLGWTREHERSMKLLGGDFRSDYDARTITLGVEARHYLTRWLYPHARVWGGTALTSLMLKDEAQPRTYREPSTATALGGIGIGCTIRTPLLRIAESRWAPQPSLGIRLEGGYMFGADNEFDLQAKGAGETPIALRESTLGTLDRNAPYVQGSLVLRM